MPAIAAAEPDLRYPTGKLQRLPEPLDDATRKRLIEAIAATPKNLGDAVHGLTESRIDTPYRPGGWTVRQLVHHVADSHMNAYIRFKLALTEDAPLVKPYDEAEWAKLVDSIETPVEVSISLLTALTDRWVRLLRAMKPNDFTRKLTHPEHGLITNDSLLVIYGWHGPHHVAHVNTLRARSGW